MPRVRNLSVLLLLISSSFVFGADPTAKLYRDTVVRFVKKSEAAGAITRQDIFVKAMSAFDRQIRMQTDKNVSYVQWKKFAEAQVLDWKKEEVEKISDVAKVLRKQLEKFNLPLPKDIRLVKTSGREEANAAYCRGNASVLPLKVLRRGSRSLQRVFIHELFHVMSSHNPVLRKSMYAIVGFKPCNPITMPKTLAHKRITNPDAPTIDYYMKITDAGVTRAIVPVLYANKDKYDTKRGGNLFQYLVFRLMVIEKKKDRWQPLLKDGRAIVVKPKTSRSYMKQIGSNTNYIIHPDEIMADNFVHLVKGTKRLKSPQIVKRLGKLLESN